MNGWLIKIAWFSGIAIWLSAWFLSRSHTENLLIKEAHYYLTNPFPGSFIGAAEGLGFLAEINEDSAGIPRSEINIALLEESTENHPHIASAEVYSTMSGSLRLDVKQREALGRVISGSSSYYLSKNGRQMPTSKYYSADVPLINGVLDEEDDAFISELLAYCQSDSFYQGYWTGFSVNAKKEWVFKPGPDSFQVLFGTDEDWQNKLRKLKAWRALPEADRAPEQWRVIDLRFKDQIVCKK